MTDTPNDTTPPKRRGRPRKYATEEERLQARRERERSPSRRQYKADWDKENGYTRQKRYQEGRSVEERREYDREYYHRKRKKKTEE